GNEFQMSFIEVAWGIGMLIGGGLLGLIKFKYNKAIAVNFTYIILGLALAVSGILPAKGYLLFVLLTALEGIAFAIYNACFTAIIQEKINPAKLGRVFSMFFSIAVLPSIFGLLFTGFLAENLGLT